MLSALIAIEILSRLSQMLSVLLPQARLPSSAPFMMTFTVRSIGLPFCVLSEHVSFDGDKPAPSPTQLCEEVDVITAVFERLLSDAAPEFSSGRRSGSSRCKKSLPHALM
jgi:hypothetical protein